MTYSRVLALKLDILNDFTAQIKSIFFAYELVIFLGYQISNYDYFFLWSTDALGSFQVNLFINTI